MIKKIIIFFAVGVAALGGGFYLRYSQEGGFPIPIFNKSVESMLTAKAFQSSGTIAMTPFRSSTIVATSSPDKPMSLAFTFDNDSFDTDLVKTAFSVATEIPSYPSALNIIQPGYVKIEGRTIGKNIFLKLNAFPQAIFNLTPFVGEWVRIDFPETLRTYYAQQDTDEPTVEQMTDLRLKFINAQILRYTETLQTETVLGDPMRHYGFIVDKERALAFIPVLSAWAQSITGKPLSTIETAQIKSMTDELTALPAQQYPAGEVFIGYDDGLMHRLIITKEFAVGDVNPVIAVDVSFSGINKPLVIEEPKNAKSLNDVISDVLREERKQPVTIAFREAVSWLSMLPKDTVADFQAAADLTSGRYRLVSISRSNYVLGLSCGNYILQVATGKLTKPQLDALRAKSALFAALQSDAKSKTDDAQLRRDILNNWTDLVVMPDTISAYGFAKIAAIDKSKPAINPEPSRAACETMPVPAKYK